jgi:hypothetical protein
MFLLENIIGTIIIFPLFDWDIKNNIENVLCCLVGTKIFFYIKWKPIENYSKIKQRSIYIYIYIPHSKIQKFKKNPQSP